MKEKEGNGELHFHSDPPHYPNVGYSPSAPNMATKPVRESSTYARTISPPTLPQTSAHRALDDTNLHSPPRASVTSTLPLAFQPYGAAVDSREAPGGENGGRDVYVPSLHQQPRGQNGRTYSHTAYQANRPGLTLRTDDTALRGANNGWRNGPREDQSSGWSSLASSAATYSAFDSLHSSAGYTSQSSAHPFIPYGPPKQEVPPDSSISVAVRESDADFVDEGNLDRPRPPALSSIAEQATGPHAAHTQPYLSKKHTRPELTSSDVHIVHESSLPSLDRFHLSTHEAEENRAGRYHGRHTLPLSHQPSRSLEGRAAVHNGYQQLDHHAVMHPPTYSTWMKLPSRPERDADAQAILK